MYLENKPKGNQVEYKKNTWSWSLHSWSKISMGGWGGGVMVMPQ